MTSLTDEQIGLRDAVRRLLAKRSDSASVRRATESPRGYDEGLWQVLCAQIGVAGLSIPERFGGLGAGLLETHVVLEELGATLTPNPLLGSGVLSAQALLALDDTAANERLLPGIADGTSIGALCWAGPAGQWEPSSAPVTAQRGSLTGEACYVLDGDHADVLLVVAHADDGIGVYEVNAKQSEVRRRHTSTMDPTRRLATVTLDGAPGQRLGGDARAALARVRDIACIALSAEQVGAMSRALQLTVDYAKNRVQFGRPIGSFQALKHRMADLHVLVEAARSASYAAVDGTGGGPPGERGVAAGAVAGGGASVAKAYCSEAFCTVAAEMIQLHGGIAITWEHDAQLYFKRAHGSAQLFGQPREHVSRLATLAGL
jgi:alkylation response protein AidB-like acyl-CoA dehydrogenase